MFSSIQLYYNIIITPTVSSCAKYISFLPSGVAVGAGMVVGTKNNENQ